MSNGSKKKVSILAVISVIFIVLGLLAIPFGEFMFGVLSRVFLLEAVCHDVLRFTLMKGLQQFTVAFIFWFTAIPFAALALVLTPHKSTKSNEKFLPLACLIISLLSIIVCSIPYPNYDNTYVVDRNRTFDGDSSDLKDTIIVPALESPMPKGKNVIWCSSFQMAWNELKDDIIKEPILLSENQEIADLLNQAEQSKQDISEDDYYARAGFVKDNIIETIQTEMAQKFPEEPVSSFDDVSLPIEIVLYAYLSANVNFNLPYFENEKELLFSNSNGDKTAITSFGLRDEDSSKYKKLRRQIQVLFAKHNLEYQLTECAIDLYKDSSPNQIVIAMVEPKDTLLETLSYIQERIHNKPRGDYYHELGINDTLLVPNLFWKVDHSFEKLVGNSLQNTGYEGAPIVKAAQTVQFRLDRSGAALKSEAVLLAGAGSTAYIFDSPFLIYMKKRGAEHPFFVMWVDNAELLEKF